VKGFLKMKIGLEFIEKTKYKNKEERDSEKGISQPPLELDYDKRKSFIELPDPAKIKVKDIDLREVIESRNSLRVYKDSKISLEELSFILWSTQGVKEIIKGKVTIRNVPSAGARHAFETYILANSVEGLQKGLYRYIALENRLVEISFEDKIDDKIMDACLCQKSVKSSAVTFIWVAIPYRMNWKYGERGYRYLYLDAGHVCQNLYLTAQAINCGVCAIGAFDDDEMNKILNIDGKEQFTIYMGTLGKI
jgi:SagB-type dehydrogenase family enzyme